MVRVGLIGEAAKTVNPPKPTVEKTEEKKVVKPATDTKVRKTK